MRLPFHYGPLWLLQRPVSHPHPKQQEVEKEVEVMALLVRAQLRGCARHFCSFVVQNLVTWPHLAVRETDKVFCWAAAGPAQPQGFLD